MKIIISPAKKMKTDTDTFTGLKLPVFLPETERLMKKLQSLEFGELKKLWGCNDKIAEENFAGFRSMDLKHSLTPAVLAYDGIQYTYMAPGVFEEGQFDYVEKHLRILSGFYGVLKPMNGIVPYRLEMQAKLETESGRDLYEFWGDKLYREVMDESRTVINLASKEYSKCISKYITKEDRFISCDFVEEDNGRLVQKGVYVKMARGEMVRFMAERNISEPEEIKDFNRGGYSYSEEKSSEGRFVFIKK